MKSDLLYQIALTQVPHVGYVHAKILALHFGSASAVFKADKSLLEKIEGIGSIRAGSIKSFKDFRELKKKSCSSKNIRSCHYLSPMNEYPKRLLNCYDPPTMLIL